MGENPCASAPVVTAADRVGEAGGVFSPGGGEIPSTAPPVASVAEDSTGNSWLSLGRLRCCLGSPNHQSIREEGKKPDN